jgi:signal transduction histidine kinase
VEAGLIDFQLLFEASPDVLLVLLPDTPRFTMVAATNSRLAVTGTTREATIGRGIFEIFPDNPDDPDATGSTNLRASLERVIATRAPDTMAVQKYDIRGPDDSFQVKYWSPKNVPVLSADGAVRYILHRVEDVTELVHASDEGAELKGRTQKMEREVVARSLELSAAVRDLRDANAKLGELDVAKTAFFSNVSHEFRTPLTLMLGPIEDALADKLTPLGAVQAARLKLAHDNALRLLKLVNVLLDFSRLEAGRLRPHCAPIDLAAVTAKLAGMYESACERAGLRLTIDCPTLSTPIWIDQGMWEKIILNLVSNAFKFTFDGEIAVRMRETEQAAVIEVEDTGTGIHESELPLIFERFHRVAGATGRTYEGTGIGLALVRELTELQGGTVGVESVPGRGSTFRVEIPKGSTHLPPEAITDHTPDLQTPRDALALAAEASRWDMRPDVDRGQIPADATTPSSGPRTRVLVVDDNAELRSYVAGLLAPSCAVTTASDGRMALNQVRTELPDIIVSDVMMPNLDGFGLVRELRADRRTAALPIILLSARAGEEAAVDGLGSGADDYLAKPFSAQELLARVRTHAELARTRREWMTQLEVANTELEAFSYSVSHDLRAPLRHVIGFAALLAEHLEKGNTAQALAHARTISEAAAKMSRLIDDLLAFSRFARTPLAKRQVDLDELVHDIRNELMASTERAGRNIEWRVERLPPIHADPSLMKQVLINLMSNAVKYSARRAHALIDIGTVAGSASEVVLFVRDNGAGFDAQYSDKLFGVFQRLHRADEFEGTGIGLANVKRIVGRHGGRVWAESVLGQGATFYIALPK